MDRSFFNQECEEIRSKQIIESIVDMTNQGFYFSKPVLADELKF